MPKSVIEQLSELDADLGTKIKELIKAHPKLAADDRQMSELFGFYLGGDETPAATTTTTTTTETPAAAATHTPTVPSAATTTSTPSTTTPAPASTSTTPSAELQTIMTTLTGLKDSMEAKLKNVITTDQLPKLEGIMLEKSIRNAHLASKIERFHKDTFNEDLNLDNIATFIDEQKKVGVVFGDIEKAYKAMVAEKLNEITIAKKVDEQVKQKTSGATVPGQTTSAGLSPAQQVIAKAKKDQSAEGGTRLQALIDKAAALDRAHEASGAVN